MPVLNLVSHSGEASASIHHVHLHIEQQLRAQGVAVRSLLLSGSSHKDFGVPLISDFDVLRRPRKHPIRYRLLRAKFKQFLRQGRYDCVIADGLLSANLVMDLKRELTPATKLLMVIHGRVRLRKAKLPALFRVLNAGHIRDWELIAVSRDSAAYLEEQLPTSERPVQVIENCIDATVLNEGLLSRKVARLALGIDSEATVVGTIGRMSAEKSYETLVRAFAVADIPGVILAMVGDGKERPALQALVKELGIADRVIFSGYMAEARRYLKAFDCFVMTSKTEGSPIALLEAMGAARPVVCSAIPPLVDALPEGYPHVFEQGDVQALARELENVIAMAASQRSDLGRDLESLTRSRFAPALFGEKYRQLVAART